MIRIGIDFIIKNVDKEFEIFGINFFNDDFLYNLKKWCYIYKQVNNVCKKTNEPELLKNVSFFILKVGFWNFLPGKKFLSWIFKFIYRNYVFKKEASKGLLLFFVVVHLFNKNSSKFYDLGDLNPMFMKFIIIITSQMFNAVILFLITFICVILSLHSYF